LDVAYESGRALPLVYRTTPAEIAPEGGPFEPALVTVARVLSGTPGVSDLLGEGVVMEGGASWSLTSILPLPEGSTGGDSPLVVVPPGRSVGTILSGALADRGLTAETPVVLVALGPDPLDARDRGDLFGVIVGGAGGVLLEGTVLHGAVITEGILDFGANGQVEFDATLLEWARRNSIVRTRLMPGSREDRITAIDG
jgi:hypothetical protein